MKMTKERMLTRKREVYQDNQEAFKKDLGESVETLFTNPEELYEQIDNAFGKKHSVIIVNLITRERLGVLYKGLSRNLALYICAHEESRSHHVKNPLYGYIVI